MKPFKAHANVFSQLSGMSILLALLPENSTESTRA